jgi:ABC-type transporter Mla subunit MlaD
MSKETTYAGKLGNIQQLSTALTANAEELAHLEGARLRLADTLNRAQEVAKQQAALTASRQEASKQLKSLLTEGERLANALRSLVKEHYGIRSEKLAEFGLQPFRGRTRKAKGETPELPPAPPPASPSDPGTRQ